MDEALIGLVGALAGGAVTATVGTWLAARARVAEELREQRLEPYQKIWAETALFSRWPWTDATYGHVKAFHLGLRQWYYGAGGIVMSENARARYGHVQDIAEAILELGRSEGDRLDDAHYRPLMQACSALRTGLTEDLESRRIRSLLLVITLAGRHGRQSIEAWLRLQRLRGRRKPTHALRSSVAP